MEIDIWKGDWGLPSIDVHCLQALVRADSSQIHLTCYLIRLRFILLVLCQILRSSSQTETDEQPIEVAVGPTAKLPAQRNVSIQV